MRDIRIMLKQKQDQKTELDRQMKMLDQDIKALEYVINMLEDGDGVLTQVDPPPRRWP